VPNTADHDPSTTRLSRLWGALLAPVLTWQSARLKRKTPRLQPPRSPAQGVAGQGPVRLRLLIVGDSSAMGVGASDADHTLAPQLAAHMVRHLTRDPGDPVAVSWQLVAAPGIGARQALELLSATELHPADMLITILGVNDALDGVAASRWLAELDALRSHARHRAKIRHIVHCAPPRLDWLPVLPQPLRWYLGVRAARLDTALRTHVRHAFRRTRFVLPVDIRHDRIEDLLAEDGFHPNDALYARWAAALSDHIDLDLSESVLQRAAMPSGFQSSGFWGQEPQAGATGAPSRFPAPPPFKPSVLPPSRLGVGPPPPSRVHPTAPGQPRSPASDSKPPIFKPPSGKTLH
jgi:lysophospholipase L1-like esterase